MCCAPSQPRSGRASRSVWCTRTARCWPAPTAWRSRAQRWAPGWCRGCAPGWRVGRLDRRAALPGRVAKPARPHRTPRCPPRLLLRTQVVTGTSAVPSFTDVPPSKKSGSSLQYGPYQDTQPFTLKPISGVPRSSRLAQAPAPCRLSWCLGGAPRLLVPLPLPSTHTCRIHAPHPAVHYENFAAFAHVPELEREIEISHWGNVYFEERYHLVRTRGTTASQPGSHGRGRCGNRPTGRPVAAQPRPASGPAAVATNAPAFARCCSRALPVRGAAWPGPAEARGRQDHRRVVALRPHDAAQRLCAGRHCRGGRHAAAHRPLALLPRRHRQHLLLGWAGAAVGWAGQAGGAEGGSEQQAGSCGTGRGGQRRYADAVDAQRAVG